MGTRAEAARVCAERHRVAGAHLGLVPGALEDARGDARVVVELAVERACGRAPKN
jgi:hypothetical protein